MSYNNSVFINQLKNIDYKPEQYLKDARKKAKLNGYNPKNLFISDKKTHKLMMFNGEKYRYFGKPNYGDYLIYKHLEKLNKVPKGYADKKRNVFHSSHTNLKNDDWKLDEFSPNYLALSINW